MSIEVNLDPGADVDCVRFVEKFLDAHEDYSVTSIDEDSGVVLAEVRYDVTVDCEAEKFDSVRL